MGNELGNKLEPPRLSFRRRKTGTARPETEVDGQTDEQIDEQIDEQVNEPADEATRVLEPVETAPEPPKASQPRRPAREVQIPSLPGPLQGHPAAALTGLVVGLFMVLAVWGCEQLSQSVRGTTSLGRAGLPLLLAIFILAVVIGALLLRSSRTPSPGSTSFLGTGLVSVLTILFLTDHVDSVWGSVVVVALAVGSFVLARWVSVRYMDS